MTEHLRKISIVPLLFGLTLLAGCESPPPPPPVVIEFCIADTVAVPGWTQQTILETGEAIYMNPNPVLTAADFENVQAAEQRWGPDLPVQEGQLAIKFECTPSGAKTLQAATAANLKKRLAIVVDGRVIMAPFIQAVIGQSGQLSGLFTTEQRQQLLDQFERAMDSAR